MDYIVENKEDMLYSQGFKLDARIPITIETLLDAVESALSKKTSCAASLLKKVDGSSSKKPRATIEEKGKKPTIALDVDNYLSKGNEASISLSILDKKVFT